jgi:8-oxo-dGTP diphosphatase
MKSPYEKKRMPRLTVDAWIRDARGRVLLVRRGRPPFEGRWGLPGGFCEWKETTEDCCARETLEETGLTVTVGRLLGVYSRPDRDPRGHNVTVLYAARSRKGTETTRLRRAGSRPPTCAGCPSPSTTAKS